MNLDNSITKKENDMDFSENFQMEKKSPEELIKELEQIDEILEQIRKDGEYWMGEYPLSSKKG